MSSSLRFFTAHGQAHRTFSEHLLCADTGQVPSWSHCHPQLPASPTSQRRTQWENGRTGFPSWACPSPCTCPPVAEPVGVKTPPGTQLFTASVSSELPSPKGPPQPSGVRSVLTLGTADTGSEPHSPKPHSHKQWGRNDPRVEWTLGDEDRKDLILVHVCGRGFRSDLCRCEGPEPQRCPTVLGLSEGTLGPTGHRRWRQGWGCGLRGPPSSATPRPSDLRPRRRLAEPCFERMTPGRGLPPHSSGSALGQMRSTTLWGTLNCRAL